MKQVRSCKPLPFVFLRIQRNRMPVTKTPFSRKTEDSFGERPAATSNVIETLVEDYGN